MDEIEQLEQAIAALENQRPALGDAVVDAALAPMREKLAALKPSPTAEQRKLVTILFADLAGFTSLAEKMDPEDVREILGGYFERWSRVIEGQGGLVEKFIGDAVMAVFGLEVAGEDDAESAIRAGLEMCQELDDMNARLEQRWGVQLEMRVGIHTGPVVISKLSERKGQDFVVVGDTVNLASRLQAVAPTGGILISHDTYRHVRGAFVVQPLEAVQVKGRSEPVQVYQVLQAKPRAFRLITRGVEGIETRLVGREAELKLLRDAYSTIVIEGERQVVTLVGEAGIGKSRLLYEFDNWLELLPEQVTYFKGRASPALQNQPFSLLRDLFSFRFQIQDSDPPQAVWEKIEAGMEGAEAAGYVGRLLGFNLGELPELEGMAEDAQQFRMRALAYLSQYFKKLADRHPVVILLEDLHWADDSSLDLVNTLDKEFAGQTLLIVCTARPALFERRPHWGEGQPFHTRVELRRLSRMDSRRLVEEILQKVDEIPDALRELIVENTEGNPFYIEELIKMLVEEGVILKGEERWQVRVERLDKIRVPPTLIEVLQARFDSLDPEQRILLQCASVVGRIFWDQAVDSLRTAVASSGTSLEPGKETQAVLTGLRRREIIYQREASAFEDTHEYLFKHALMRDVTYESLLKRVRRSLHAHAAHWLEAVTQRSRRADEYALLIAEHYQQAGEASPAAAWYQRAGQRAAGQFANSEAVYAFSRALDLLPEGDLPGRFELQMERVKVFDLQGDRQAQAQDIEALRSLADQLEDDRCRAEAALRQAEYGFATGDYSLAISAGEEVVGFAHAAQAAEVEAEGHLLLAGTLIRQGGLESAEAATGQAMALARQHGLRKIEAHGERNLGLIAYYLSDPAKAREHFEQALNLFIETGDRQGEAMSLNNLGGATYNLGDTLAAGAYYERSYRLSREIGDRTGELRGLNNQGIVAITLGQYAHAEELYLNALQVSREIGHRSHEISVLDNLGNLALFQNHYTQALVYHAQSLEVAREIGDRMPERDLIVNMGHTYLALGDLEGALRYLQEALDLNRELNSREGEINALDILCRYYSELGDYATARELGEQAVAISRELGTQLNEAIALTALGNVLADAGQPAEAAEALREALEIQRRLGDAHRETPILAILGRASLDMGDTGQARAYVEEFLSAVEKHPIEGIDQPMRTYLAAIRVLEALDDPRAAALLEKAHSLLQEWAGMIEDEGLRRSLLENVRANREVVDAWALTTALSTDAASAQNADTAQNGLNGLDGST